jgi:Holliday junction resolvase RusA-like endonuclease
MNPYAIRFTVVGEPAPAGSKAHGRRKDGTIFTYDMGERRKTKPRTSHWKKLVRTAAITAMIGRDPLEGPLHLVLKFWLPRPQSVSEKKRPYPTVAPDLTKLVRSTEDAMKGVVWRDDSQVIRQHAIKVYGDPPAAEIVVHPIDT